MDEKKFIVAVLAFVLLTNIFVLFKIPYLQEFFGFLFLLLLPGFLILRALKINDIGIWKLLVYSVGLSIAFLMIMGAMISFLYPAFGLSTPLSTKSLLFTLDVLLAFLLFARKNSGFSEELENDNEPLNRKNRFLFFLPFLFPIIAAIEASMFRNSFNGAIPMALIGIISIYVFFLAIINKNDDIPKKVFISAIFMIALSLLFMVALRPGHLFGSDVHGEYLASQMTKDGLQWKPMNYAYNISLCVSLLPVILSSILNVSEEMFFVLIAQILFALVPVVIFLFLSKYARPLHAFLSAFFFISIEIFSIFMSIVRSEIAFLLVALSILVFFDDKLDALGKKILFIVFAVAIIMSHAAVSYVYFGLLLIWALFDHFGKKDLQGPKIATLTTVLLFFAVIFFWHGQIISTPFYGLIKFIEEVIKNIANAFILETRSEVALSSLRIPTGETLVRIGRYVSLLMKIFIFVGVCSLVKNFRKTGIDKKFVVASAYSFVFVILSIVMPMITKNIDIERVFLQSLIVLCFCCTLGAKSIFESLKINERKVDILIVLMLLLFFLFQSGFIYGLFDIQTSPALSDDSHAHRVWFVHDSEIAAAKWLSMQNPGRVYGDFYALSRLWSYGGIIPHYSFAEKPAIGYTIQENSALVNAYVYMRQDNVAHNSFIARENYRYRYVENMILMMVGKNKVYDGEGGWVFR